MDWVQSFQWDSTVLLINFELYLRKSNFSNKPSLVRIRFAVKISLAVLKTLSNNRDIYSNTWQVRNTKSILTPIFKWSCCCYDNRNVFLLHSDVLLVQIDFKFFENLSTSGWRGPFCSIDCVVQIAFFLAGRRTNSFSLHLAFTFRQHLGTVLLSAAREIFKYWQ
jgi:hypothetical protein